MTYLIHQQPPHSDGYPGGIEFLASSLGQVLTPDTVSNEIKSQRWRRHLATLIFHDYEELLHLDRHVSSVHLEHVHGWFSLLLSILQLHCIFGRIAFSSFEEHFGTELVALSCQCISIYIMQLPLRNSVWIKAILPTTRRHFADDNAGNYLWHQINIHDFIPFCVSTQSRTIISITFCPYHVSRDRRC